MDYLEVENRNGIALLRLARGKVNAINGAVVDEIHARLNDLENDSAVQAVLLTGSGSFFSFGFDVPELLPHTREQFAGFLNRFTRLYTYMFFYPKPIVAALNGHTIAGGCMLAMACDQRIMVSGKAKISLNEIELGVPVFAGITEILRFWVGSRISTQILYSGALYSAEEAMGLGLIDEVSTPESLLRVATDTASELGMKPTIAFSGLKRLLREPLFQDIPRREDETISRFVDAWCSEATQEILMNVKIRS